MTDAFGKLIGKPEKEANAILMSKGGISQPVNAKNLMGRRRGRRFTERGLIFDTCWPARGGTLCGCGLQPARKGGER